jgi:hypothetical protein
MPLFCLFFFVVVDTASDTAAAAKGQCSVQERLYSNKGTNRADQMLLDFYDILNLPPLTHD